MTARKRPTPKKRKRASPPKSSKKPPNRDKADPQKGERQKITLYVRSELVQRARGAVLWAAMQGEDTPPSLSALFDEALERELKRLTADPKPHAGEFPLIKRGLPGGRPKGS
jgi:hypothetical protein